ncbi:GDCCVxC domain-containing (seleno)protein [Sphingopyxis sp. LC81]|uniref:GDCCVxC domain-containing (seleno)protein n=1 Tax=Sphingopyxis sp. LC81 TaxID=1502850 RepID=UPI0009DF43BA
MQTASTIACPKCGKASTETMPTNACQFFYDCKHCGVMLRPLPGDCCVFCSYADVPCPPIQETKSGGGSSACCSPTDAARKCRSNRQDTERR